VHLPELAQRIHVSGYYIQVAGAPHLGAVNAALERVALGDERAFLTSFGGPGPSRGLDHDLTYRAAPDTRLLSANRLVVSALVPVLKLVGTGNDGAYWLSITIRVPSGKAVKLTDLFTSPPRALRAIALSAEHLLTAGNACVRGSLAYPPLGYRAGFRASIVNYRHFALIRGGLAFGFDINRVAGSSCGRVEVTVPYSAVQTDLSPLGQTLVTAVTHPR
jgi:hypothetical protein